MRPVPGAMSDNGDLVSQLERILVPAAAAQMIIATFLRYPMFHAALAACHIYKD